MFVKILLVILAIGAVAIAFGAWRRREETLNRRRDAPPPARGAAERREPEAADTLRCRVCDAFVPVGAKAACSRADCPFA